MGWFKEKATVKKFKPASKDGKQKAFAFVLLNGDKREVYVGPDILAAARVSELKPGQAVKVKHEPSVKRPGSLQATVISA
jgi:cold shock CspA family protein